MFAVIHTGGKQHRVSENDRIVVERLSADPGATVAFDKVLMLVGDAEAPLIGDAVPGTARVFGQVLEQKRGAKIIVFKKKRRQGYRRKRGHRQYQTVVRIMSISASGEAPDLDSLAAETAAPAVATQAIVEPAADETPGADEVRTDDAVAEAASDETKAEATSDEETRKE